MSVLRARESESGEPSDCSSESIFPLRLSAFENYMVIDDRPSHPMTFVIEIEVSGKLCGDALEAAVGESLRRHPLLNARISRRWNGRCWVPSRTPPKVEWIRGTTPLPEKLPRLNLHREPGLQVWIAPRDEGGSIYFGFHHAATDGLGAMQFIGDVLVGYAHRTPAEEVPARRPVDLQALRHRACLESPNVAPGQTPLSRAREFFRQLGRSAATLAVPQPAPHLGEDSLQTIPPFVSRTLDREFVMGLKRAAAQRLLHPNDLYVAALFKTVHDWNRRHSSADNRRILRLSLPTSLRTPQHDRCPAANVVNMVFLNRRETDCGDLDALLERANELANASTHDRVFFRAMRWARCVPGLMELGSRLPYSFATMVLTNVGDVKRQFGVRFPLKRGRCVAGSMTVEALRGTAPLRPGTHVGVSVGTYAGQLFVNAICDPHRYSRADAEQFLSLFLSQLDQLVAAASRRAAA